MRIVLADLKGLRGFVSKDTVAAGYGSRLLPFSRTLRPNSENATTVTFNPVAITSA